jgi:hypothetical protein
MTWTIVTTDPEDVSTSNKDTSVWLWEIERSGDQRYVEVTLTLPSMAADNPLAEVREARATKGRIAVERFLDDDDPPRHILVSTNGISV